MRWREKHARAILHGTSVSLSRPRDAPYPSMCMLQHVAAPGFGAEHGGLKHAAACCGTKNFAFFCGDSQLSVCSVCSVCTGDILSDLSSVLYYLSCHDGVNTTINTNHTTFPIRWDQADQGITRSTSDCLQWAVDEGIGEGLTLTEASEEGRPGKIYCNLRAIWLGSKGAVFEVHGRKQEKF